MVLYIDEACRESSKASSFLPQGNCASSISGVRRGAGGHPEEAAHTSATPFARRACDGVLMKPVLFPLQVLDGALEDIQKKRHKRDPFREGYLRLCLSAFAQPAQVQTVSGLQCARPIPLSLWGAAAETHVTACCCRRSVSSSVAMLVHAGW